MHPSPLRVQFGAGVGYRGCSAVPEAQERELSCQLPHCRFQVPETVSPGSTLVTLRCTNPASAKGCLSYALEGPPASRFRFRMEGPQLQVSGATGCAGDIGEPSGTVRTTSHVLSHWVLCWGSRGCRHPYACLFLPSLPLASLASQFAGYPGSA